MAVHGSYGIKNTILYYKNDTEVRLVIPSEVVWNPPVVIFVISVSYPFYKDSHMIFFPSMVQDGTLPVISKVITPVTNLQGRWKRGPITPFVTGRGPTLYPSQGFTFFWRDCPWSLWRRSKEYSHRPAFTERWTNALHHCWTLQGGTSYTWGEITPV